MTETTTVRNNLMNQEGYTGYCGDFHCKAGMPRTKWSSELNQFKCKCGWISQYPKDFIERYKLKWNK